MWGWSTVSIICSSLWKRSRSSCLGRQGSFTATGCPRYVPCITRLVPPTASGCQSAAPRSSCRFTSNLTAVLVQHPRMHAVVGASIAAGVVKAARD